MKVSFFSLCHKGVDPDNPNEKNPWNPMISDADITPLNSVDGCCQSCYLPEYNVFDCARARKHPQNKAMYEQVHQWTPFAKNYAKTLGSAGVGRSPRYWFYAFFMTGPSEACRNEAAVYRNMASHLHSSSRSSARHSYSAASDSFADSSSAATTIDFLPGTGVMMYTLNSS